MAEAKSVVIKLTNEQREAIKRATGQDMTELKVEALAGRDAAAILESRKAPFAPEAERKAPFAQEAERKAPFAEDEKRKAPFAQEAERKAPLATNDE